MRKCDIAIAAAVKSCKKETPPQSDYYFEIATRALDDYGTRFKNKK